MTSFPKTTHFIEACDVTFLALTQKERKWLVNGCAAVVDVIIVCLLANFFFSAGKPLLLTLIASKMQVEADDSKTAKLVLHVAKNYDRALSLF